MICRGKVSEIIVVNESVAQVIIKVKRGEIYLPVAFIALSSIKVLMQQINVEKGDTVKIEYYLKSKKWQDKYKTDAIIHSIRIIAKKPSQLLIDMETGEIFSR
jgi:hypothetical protein